MIFKSKKIERTATLTKQACEGILSYCKMNHPNEMVLILKGKSKKGAVFIDSLVIPPFSETGPIFAGFPSSFLPLDLSYVGIAHSHPVGSADPSLEDLNNFFGLVSIIVKSPYNEDDVFAWDSSGNSIAITISE
jgi:proteasome lid subunit RPN8/RPN11|tara:strand:- start:635 stop:1036 length:402 start_codon:yes stop_codon:yes gene_type:complete